MDWRFFLKLTLVLLMVTPVSVRAEEDRVRLFGRGIQKRGTDDSVALACIAFEDCTKARFIHFNGDGTYEWVGPVIEVPQSSDDHLQKKSERLRLRYFLAERLDKRPLLKGTVASIAVFLYLVSGLVIASYLPPSTPAFWSVFTVMAPALIAAPDFNWEGMMISGKSEKIYTATHDQSKWSWSERPKNVGGKKYDRFLKALKSQPDDTRRFQYLNRLEDRIRKLMDKGVYFGCMDGVICYEGY